MITLPMLHAAKQMTHVSRAMLATTRHTALHTSQAVQIHSTAQTCVLTNLKISVSERGPYGSEKAFWRPKTSGFNHNVNTDDPTWMGMAYCNGSSNEWVLCNQPDDPSTIESPAPCSCPTATSDRSMTLSAASSLSATASLPSAVGFEINYMAGHYPTSPAAVTTVSASTTQQSSTGDQGYTITALATVTAPTPTTSSSPSAQATPTSHGLGKNSIIGVSVGSSAGGFLLLAGLVLSFRRRFLARQGQQKVDGANTVEANDKAPTASSNTELAATGGAQNESAGNEQSSWAGSPRTSAVSGSDNRWPRPWSMGSEFDGTGAGTISSVASPGRMQPIWEQDHEQVQRIELAADPLVELEA